MKLQRQATQTWIQMADTFLQHFTWLTDSYVLDFYCDGHWQKMPPSWRLFLLQLQPHELGCWLDTQHNHNDNKHLIGKSIAPLSLLSFKAAAKLLSLRRTLSETILDKEMEKIRKESVKTEPTAEFKNLFNRHVKLKKRHEIQSISNIVCSLCSATDTESVLDIGAGIGHLARFLSYGSGLQLICVDCVQNYNSSASKFDNELQSFISKKRGNNSRNSAVSPPKHKCLKLEMDTHDKYLQSFETNFGIVGLHTCGNLAPVILHNFVNSPAKFFLSVGCCYMKLDHKGFPLSNFSKELRINVSYEGLEVACHAIEQYCQRLKDGFVLKLLTHSYRATLETILVSRFGIRKAGLKGVPNSEKLTFPEYARRAVESLDIVLSDQDVDNERVTEMLQDWYRVVLFFSLRLLCANVIETLVVLDRGLFILENCPNASLNLSPVFHPNISPRNLALFGTK